MLGKMLIHGVVAAVIIGSAAGVYAQAKDNGYLVPGAPAAQRQEPAATAKPGDGYIRPESSRRDDERSHAAKAERHGERHERKRDHDHDDD